MRVLYLTNKDSLVEKEILTAINSTNDEIEIYRTRFLLKEVQNKFDFIVSDRARFLISEDIINHFNKKIINLHPSFLPWCRGYHPNYWSIKKNLPHGVTIHYIDKNIDTGDILLQKEVSYKKNDTLRTSYNRLRFEMLNLFVNNWEKIRNNKIKSFKQDNSINSIFYKKDFNGIFEKLSKGWDTSIKDI